MASIDVRATYEGLKTLFASLSGLAVTGDVDGEFQFPPDDTMATLKFEILGIVGVGTDERRREYDENISIPGDLYEPDPDNPSERLGGIVESTCGNRRVTITVVCECHRQDRTAHLYLERLRDKLGQRSARQAMAALGVPIQRILTSHNVSYEVDGRMVSAHAFDMICNAATELVDSPITTIETVDATLTVS